MQGALNYTVILIEPKFFNEEEHYEHHQGKEEEQKHQGIPMSSIEDGSATEEE